MPLKEYITAKNIVFIILVLIILKFLSMISAIALLFFASYVIACSLNPIVDFFSKKMKRPMAATLVLTGTLTVFFAFFVPIIFVAVKQLQSFVAFLPSKIKMLNDFILTHDFYGHQLSDIISIEKLIASTSPFASGIVNQSINITIGFAQGIMFFLAICMIVFYMLADKDVIRNDFIKFFPIKMKEKATMLYDTISHKVGGYVIAQILSMVAIGVLTTIGLMLVRVDYAISLGLITGILDIIPIIGPTIAVILCILTAYQMGPITIGLVIFMFLAAQWIANNLIRPVVFGKFLDLHPLIIIFALLVAAQFLGVLGVVLAPAIAALVCVLFDELYIKPINKG